MYDGDDDENAASEVVVFSRCVAGYDSVAVLGLRKREMKLLIPGEADAGGLGSGDKALP